MSLGFLLALLLNSWSMMLVKRFSRLRSESPISLQWQSSCLVSTIMMMSQIKVLTQHRMIQLPCSVAARPKGSRDLTQPPMLMSPNRSRPNRHLVAYLMYRPQVRLRFEFQRQLTTMIGRSPTRTDVVDPARFKDRLMIRLESIGCRFVSCPVHTFI